VMHTFFALRCDWWRLVRFVEMGWKVESPVHLICYLWS
jgi:hypothetical protein